MSFQPFFFLYVKNTTKPTDLVYVLFSTSCQGKYWIKQTTLPPLSLGLLTELTSSIPWSFLSYLFGNNFVNIFMLFFNITWLLVYSQVVQPSNSRTLSSAQKKLLTHKQSLPIPSLLSPWQPLNYFLSVGTFHIIFLFGIFHINGIILCDLDSFVSGLFRYAPLSSFIHIVACIYTSFLVMAEQPMTWYATFYLSTISNGYFGCSHFGAIINTAMNIYVYEFLCTHIFPILFRI